MNCFSEINIKKLHQFVSNNVEDYDKQTNSCSFKVDEVDVLIYFYSEVNFDEMKETPLKDLNDREKLFSKHGVFDRSIVVVYPIIREPDIDFIPINKYAFNEISVYDYDGRIDISYWTEKNDPILLQKIAEEIKQMSKNV